MKKSSNMTKLLTAVLTLALLCSCGAPRAGSAGGAPESESAEVMAPAHTPAPTPTPVPTATPSPVPEAVPAPLVEPVPGTIHADVDFDDLEWYLYDMAEFNAMADTLRTLSDAEQVDALYDRLLTEYTRLRTLSELSSIRLYAAGGGDPALADAVQQTDELLTQAGDTLRSAVSAALSGSASRELSEHLGQETAEYMSDYEDMTDREAELWNRETELELTYNELLSRDDLSDPEFNYRAAVAFLELVKVRNELAELYGYDSYAELAYQSIYGRDLTPEDAASLCRAIKPLAREYYRDCYYCDVFYDGPIGIRSAGELMDLLREYMPRISDQAAEAQRYMEDHNMYLLESTEIVSNLGFTTTLPLYGAPYLFLGLDGDVYDALSIFHEFGHYYDAYVNPEPDPLNSLGSYDVFEIHSTAMEALFYGWYDEIFGAEADAARIYCLDKLIDNVVSGCLYDEFQQYVYAHPDLTPDEVTAVFVRIAESYGMEFYSPSQRYMWSGVTHNFESPFYYISYAFSTLASLQLWSMAERDREGAIALYNELIACGAYEKGYCELLRDLGMRVFTEDLDACIRDAYTTLHSLCVRYETGQAA